jgi:hypothetical protein
VRAIAYQIRRLHAVGGNSSSSTPPDIGKSPIVLLQKQGATFPRV